jgi:hypothetical protein
MTRSYEVTRSLGVGGMAQVFEAVAVGPSGFRRRVALKNVLPELAENPAILRMFRQELELASRLHHANIVQIIDCGVRDGLPFLVTELVDGLDLRRALLQSARAEQPLPLDVALHIALELALALRYLHAVRGERGQALGIVHRDVTPSNVLLSWAGDVKLGDFGIAWHGERQERTSVGVVKGKERFLAPEQLAGARPTQAVDIFALGTTLSDLLAAIDAEPAGAAAIADLEDLAVAACAPDPSVRPGADHVAVILDGLQRQVARQPGRVALEAWLAALRSAVEMRSGIDRLFGLPGPTAAPSAVVSLEPTRPRPEPRAIAEDATREARLPPRPPVQEPVAASVIPARAVGHADVRSSRPFTLAPIPVAPFHQWPLQEHHDAWGFLWFVAPRFVVTQTSVVHGTIAGADFFHDCMDALLAAHIEGLRAVGGLYVVHDLRTLRSYERGARSHFVERMRARRALGAYLAGSFASVHDDPFLRLAAQGVNLASSLAGNGPVHLVRDPAEALRSLGIDRPAPDARWPARGA